MRGLVAGALSGGLIAAVAVAGTTQSAPQTSAAQTNQSTTLGSPAVSCVPPNISGLTPEQVAIAKAGVDAADRAKAGDAGAVIITATGIVESDLKDLDHGDRDSIGWLQQRPSQGWVNGGDPAKAADDFFDALRRIDGWRSLPPGTAAQAVQRSAHPDRYGARVTQARGIVAAVRGAKCDAPVQTVAGACKPSGSPAESGLTPAALQALRCGAAAFPKVTTFGGVGGRPNASDHPSGRAVDLMIPAWSAPAGKKHGWDVANWYVANARTLDVKYIIWDDQIWRPGGSKQGWRPYLHPNGKTSNPTLRHLDHVHVSVNR